MWAHADHPPGPREGCQVFLLGPLESTPPNAQQLLGGPKMEGTQRAAPLADRMAEALDPEVGPGQDKCCLQEAGSEQGSGQGQALLGVGLWFRG